MHIRTTKGTLKITDAQVPPSKTLTEMIQGGAQALVCSHLNGCIGVHVHQGREPVL